MVFCVSRGFIRDDALLSSPLRSACVLVGARLLVRKPTSEGNRRQPPGNFKAPLFATRYFSERVVRSNAKRPRLVCFFRSRSSAIFRRACELAIGSALFSDRTYLFISHAFRFVKNVRGAFLHFYTRDELKNTYFFKASVYVCAMETKILYIYFDVPASH